MLNTKKMESVMGLILTLGTLLSAAIVLIGGMIYLNQHGTEQIATVFSQSAPAKLHFALLWKALLTGSSTAFIELGLLTLIATQLLRVSMLVAFYYLIHDYFYTLISGFVLLTLIGSFCWH